MTFVKRFGLLACVLAAALPASAGVIVPGANAGVEGNSNNGYPFNIANFSVTSMRYQQVYSSTAFSGPITITGISFRPDGSTGAAFSATLTDIQINLSTISAGPDALSTTFASNVGGDDTIVYARGTLPLSSSNTGAGPRDFDIHIIFTTPFLYNPASGNLLLDVRNFGGGRTTQFDAQDAVDSVSRVFSTDVTATSGTADTTGLITQFDTSVPEPVTLGLCGAGLLVLALARRRRFTN